MDKVFYLDERIIVPIEVQLSETGVYIYRVFDRDINQTLFIGNTFIEGMQEYVNIEYPDIEGYEPIVSDASAPTRIQVTQRSTTIIVEYKPRTYNISYILNGGKQGTSVVHYQYTQHNFPYSYQTPFSPTPTACRRP